MKTTIPQHKTATPWTPEPPHKSQWTKHQLFSLLTAPQPTLCNVNGLVGYLSSIEREDGSGSKFNITLNTNCGKSRTFVRTID